VSFQRVEMIQGKQRRRW